MSAYDFSFSRPSISDLKAAGCTIVCRYVLGQGKAIDKAELDSYLAAGLGVVFIQEYGANDIAGGYAAGVAAAEAVVAQLQVLGVWPVPVYFTADEDVPDASVAEPFYEGAESIMTAPLMGDYAEGIIMLDLHAKGISTFHWLSESTGFPGYQEALASGIVDLEQLYNASTVPGTDLNNVLHADVGQYPRPTPKPPTKEETVMLKTETIGSIFHTFELDVAGGIWHKREPIPNPNGASGSTNEKLPALLPYADFTIDQVGSQWVLQAQAAAPANSPRSQYDGVYRYISLDGGMTFPFAYKVP